MNISYIHGGEKKKLLIRLSEQFGIENLPYLLIRTGKEKVRAFTGSLSKDEINELGSIANVEIIGLYLFKEEHDLRLSFEAPIALKDQITKGIIEISDTDAEEWMRGFDLPMQISPGAVVVKNKEDFLGCGRSTGQKIANYVPKDRRIKSKRSS
jgi:NOL1/NOP2/fmu family ribosome biogenesis protein